MYPRVGVMNKRGWVRIFEAFIAVLLITLALLVLLNQGYFRKGEDTSKIYDAEISILREIQTTDSLREEVLAIDEGSLPAIWGEGFPANTKTKITAATPSYLNCEATICTTDDACTYSGSVNDRGIYAKSTLITASLTQGFKPRQLKIFCWLK